MAEPYEQALERALALVDEIRSAREKPSQDAAAGLLQMVAEELLLAAIHSTAAARGLPPERATRAVFLALHNQITRRLEQRPS
jgi:hypothetical protein